MAERAQLFVKTGMPGAEPEGLYAAVAEQYDAAVIRADAFRERVARENPQPIRDFTTLVRSAMNRRTAELLSSGHSVLYDSFLNAWRRQQALFDVATEVGAIVNVLCVMAPWELIEERLRDRHERGALVLDKPKLGTIDRYVTHIARMSEHMDMVWSNQDETIRVVDLDGTRTVPELLGYIAVELQP